MKKKLVAIAVAGLLVAPLAHAQTANVTLYGRLNMDIDFVSSATEDDLGKLNRVSSNASRIGFKGSESLGGGLNAIFQIESQFAGDAGGGTLASRDTWLGLQGNWGTVKLGYMYTPYDNIHAIFGNAPTFTTSILSTAALWAQGGSTRDRGCFDCRVSNTVRYESPKIAGFSGMVQYATDETDKHGWVGGVGLFYDNAGLQVGAVYDYNAKMRSYTNAATAQTTRVDDQSFTVAVAYNFGFIRPAIMYEHTEYEANYNKDKLKRDLYGGSVTVPIGPATLYAFYGYADKGKGDGLCVGYICGGSDTGAQQYEVSISYPLSKRTVTYLGYVMVDNDSNARYTFGSNGNSYNGFAGAKPGVDQQGIVLGAVHFF